MTRLVEILKRWWPVPAFIVGSVIAQILLRPDPTPVGHAAGHYSNATVLFAIAPAVGITIWASAAGLRRHPAFWLLNAAIVDVPRPRHRDHRHRLAAPTSEAASTTSLRRNRTGTHQRSSRTTVRPDHCVGQ